MSNDQSEDDMDIKVEILKKKYLERKSRIPGSTEPLLSVKCEENPAKLCAITKTEDTKLSPRSREINYSRALKELSEAVSNRPESFDYDESTMGSEEGYSKKTDNMEEILCTETDVTLPSNLLCTSSSFGTAPAWFTGGEGIWEQARSPTSVGKIYQEMLQIYQKLQTRAAELCERELELQRREQLLLKHQSTVHRLRTIEEYVLDRVTIMQKQHQQEMEQLRAALKEKTKENKRLKSSFDSIKELNDTMRKQLNDVRDQNKRLENQSRKVQTRVANLQRKCEYCMTYRERENVAPELLGPKPPKTDKFLRSTKVSKSASNSTNLKLLSSMMDWIVEGQLFKSEGAKAESEFDPHGIRHLSLHERCTKLLPALVDQLQQAEAFLQLPLLRFIYWLLAQLEHSTQHPPLTSTLRRLGEAVNQKSPPLLRSPCLRTRFFSSVIILKTISQVDILAQTLEVLCGIVADDEGRGIFIQYKALTAIVSLLRTGCPGLLALSLDILLHMSVESRHLPAFLEMCSTEQFFSCATSLLRNPRMDLAIAEKLGVILEKLSGIRKNRRLFESSSLHLLLQEMHRTADSAQAFLNINLSSILFNLGMTTRPFCIY